MAILECEIYVPNNETEKGASIPIAEVYQVETGKPIFSTFEHVPPRSQLSSHPPKNCPDGGQWGITNYIGNKTGLLTCATFAVCGVLGLVVLACPQDEKDAYLYQGKVYDAGGTLMGPEVFIRFTPTRNKRDFY